MKKDKLGMHVKLDMHVKFTKEYVGINLMVKVTHVNFCVSLSNVTELSFVSDKSIKFVKFETDLSTCIGSNNNIYRFNVSHMCPYSCISKINS